MKTKYIELQILLTASASAINSSSSSLESMVPSMLATFFSSFMLIKPSLSRSKILNASLCKNNSMAEFSDFPYFKSASSSFSPAFFFIMLRNSSNSIVPFPSMSTSITRLSSSSSVGFWPIALRTPSNSSGDMVPLPS